MVSSLVAASVRAAIVPTIYKSESSHVKNATKDNAIDIGDLTQDSASDTGYGTSLQVSSKLTGSDTTEYYDFTLTGSNIKLDFSSDEKKSTRIVLYNNLGNIVADSQGNAVQRAKYRSMTSGLGLSADSGTYTMEVTYSKRADDTKDIDYGFKLYSGDTYASIYKNIVEAQAYDASAYGSVTATSDAELYTASAYNKINTSAYDAITIGWLMADLDMLDVYSKLTNDDPTNYYLFTFEEGETLKFGLNSSTTNDANSLRVQLLDMTGTYIFADNEGTEAQKQAYKELTSHAGLFVNPGTFVVKVTYASDVVTKTEQVYEFGIFSGSIYSAEYKTASAQTYANAMLNGEVEGSSTSSAIAAYLTAQMNEEEDYLSTKISDALSSLY